MDGYVKHKTPAVTYTSTLSGGIGSQALRRFYGEYFLGKLPPSMRIRLLSRTTGADRIVDELYISFQHTQEIPWMLPGIPATEKRIEIILVSIVSMRGGRLSSEHVYWDQASVLVQAGLLDPKLVPSGVQGVDRLPVIGREAARRILHEDPELEQEDYHNRMIRRANARSRRERSERASTVADESGAEFKSEAEMGNGNKAKGKSVLERRPPKLQRGQTEKTENGGDEGTATETESTAPSKPENGDHKAYVEDGNGEEHS
jgi:hypothetical protein